MGKLTLKMMTATWLGLATAGTPSILVSAPLAGPADDAKVAPVPASAGNASADYDALFGAEEKRVELSHSVKDCARFAVELVEKAKSLADEPALAQLIYNKAYKYGSKDVIGYPAAEEAAVHLANSAKDPALEVEWKSKLESLYELEFRAGVGPQRSRAGEALISMELDESRALTEKRQYSDASKELRSAMATATSIHSARADEISQLAKEAQNRLTAADTAERLRKRLTQGESEATRRRIFALYLLDLDDPATAVNYAQSDDGEAHLMATLAAGNQNELSDSACLKLAAWYTQLGLHASSMGKGVAVGRAISLYGQYLRTHESQDAGRLEATQALSPLLSDFDKSAPSSRWSARIMLWNQHNGPLADRGSTSANVILFSGDQAIWRRDNIALAWEPASDVCNAVFAPDIPFDRVRVEITGYRGGGGGLAEIQVFRGSTNIASGATARSGTAPAAAAYTADHVVDGVVSSAEHGKGYWLLPDRTLGWVEVLLRKESVK